MANKQKNERSARRLMKSSSDKRLETLIGRLMRSEADSADLIDYDKIISERLRISKPQQYHRNGVVRQFSSRVSKEMTRRLPIDTENPYDKNKSNKKPLRAKA